jgi:hypothetical protein
VGDCGLRTVCLFPFPLPLVQFSKEKNFVRETRRAGSNYFKASSTPSTSPAPCLLPPERLHSTCSSRYHIQRRLTGCVKISSSRPNQPFRSFPAPSPNSATFLAQSKPHISPLWSLLTSTMSILPMKIEEKRQDV